MLSRHSSVPLLVRHHQNEANGPRMNRRQGIALVEAGPKLKLEVHEHTLDFERQDLIGPEKHEIDPTAEVTRGNLEGRTPGARCAGHQELGDTQLRGVAQRWLAANVGPQGQVHTHGLRHRAQGVDLHHTVATPDAPHRGGRDPCRPRQLAIGEPVHRLRSSDLVSDAQHLNARPATSCLGTPHSPMMTAKPVSPAYQPLTGAAPLACSPYRPKSGHGLLWSWVCKLHEPP